MWNEIIIEEPPQKCATEAEVAAFEARQGVVLPQDHRAFLKKFGEGVLFNHYRIFGIDKIDAEADEFRSRWQDYFHWTDADSALTQEDMADCIIIGDSFNADELVLSRRHPGEIFYFSADVDSITRLGPSLEAAVRALVDKLSAEIARYPKDDEDDEEDEWNLAPVYNWSEF